MMGAHSFLCVLGVDGDTLPDHLVDPLLDYMGPVAATDVVRSHTSLCVVRRSHDPGSAELVRHGSFIGVGVARLDNRVEVESWLRGRPTSLPQDASDLDLAVLAIARLGPASVCRLLGDFGFVVYDSACHTALAARDAFGVKPVFYAERDGALLVSSHAQLLARSAFDEAFIAHFLLGDETTGPWTAYSGVTRLLDGEYLKWNGRCSTLTRYWSPANVPLVSLPFQQARDEFERQFAAAVCSRIKANTAVWTELSGGLDSSSIAVVAHQLGAAGVTPPLGGTVTWVDSLGDGDERPYVEAVASSLHLRNECIVDDWAWRDDGKLPPLTDEPLSHYLFFARDRLVCQTLRQAGARVLLSGHGSDQYLTGNYHYITDHVARRAPITAACALADVAQAHHASFWRVAWHYAAVPFLPAPLRGPAAPLPYLESPPWLEPSFVRRNCVRDLLRARIPAGSGSSLFLTETYRNLNTIPNWNARTTDPDGLEMRYPFLSRPLVELVLSLPPESIIRPGISKYILREAMHNLLPEAVRQRRTKGGLDIRFAWSLNRERHRLARLLREPILGDLGCVRPNRLREAVEAARCGHLPCASFLLCVLALETWLAVHAGRWDVQPSTGPWSDKHAA